MAPAVGKAVSQREGWSGSASAPFQRSDGLQRYHRSRRGLQFNLIPSGVVRTRPRGSSTRPSMGDPWATLRNHEPLGHVSALCGRGSNKTWKPRQCVCP